MGILIGSAVIPIILCMSWEKLTGNGMVAGGISGTTTALIAWLSVASLYGDGLSDFLQNTGDYDFINLFFWQYNTFSLLI